MSQKLISYFCFPQKRLLVFFDSGQVKNFIWRKFVTYGTPCHASGYPVVCYNHVTYRTPCHASSHLMTPNDTDMRERFLLSGFCYLALLPGGFKASLGAGSSTSKLAGLHADLWNITPIKLFVWITAIHKRVILAGFT